MCVFTPRRRATARPQHGYSVFWLSLSKWWQVWKVLPRSLTAQRNLRAQWTTMTSVTFTLTLATTATPKPPPIARRADKHMRYLLHHKTHLRSSLMHSILQDKTAAKCHFLLRCPKGKWLPDRKQPTFASRKQVMWSIKPREAANPRLLYSFWK